MAGKLNETGVKVHPRTAEVLIRQVGGDLRLLDMEIRKLATYAGPSGSITPETVTELVSRTLEQDVFKLVDRVARRRTAEGIALFTICCRTGRSRSASALIIRQFRLMLRVKVLAAKGMSEREIASTLKVHPYPVKLALRQVNTCSEGALREWLFQSDRGGTGDQVRPDRQDHGGGAPDSVRPVRRSIAISHIRVEKGSGRWGGGEPAFCKRSQPSHHPRPYRMV